MIVKNLYLYWGNNNPLSFMRYMTVKSFMQFNPDWKVIIYIPAKPIKETNWETPENKYELNCENYLIRLEKEENVNIKVFDFDSHPLLNKIEFKGEVQRSDVFRWYLMSMENGLWSDFDILYIRAIDKLFLKDLSLCRYKENEMKVNAKYTYPIGFFYCGNKIGNRFFNKAIEEIINKKESFRYQGFGKDVIKKIVEEYKRKALWVYINWINPDVVYSFRDEVAKNWLVQKENSKFDNFLLSNIVNEAIGIHWYGGWNLKELENNINENTIGEYINIPIIKLMESVLNEDIKWEI